MKFKERYMREREERRQRRKRRKQAENIDETKPCIDETKEDVKIIKTNARKITLKSQKKMF